VVAWMESQVEVGCSLQWAGNTRNTVHATNESHVCWSLPQGHGDGDDEDGTAEDTRRTNARNSTSDD
jgi:hypothetical protein